MDRPITAAARNGTILVVDDDELIRTIVSRTLGEAGYHVTLAEDGRQGLDRLEEAVPDLIVSDVMMPEVGGLEMLAAVRANPLTRPIPIILLTSMGATDDVVRGLALGADDYLRKPFAPEELLARVNAKIDRPPVPVSDLERDRLTGALSEVRFVEEARREVERASRGGDDGVIAILDVEERPALQARFGQRSLDQVARQLGSLIAELASGLDLVGRDSQGRFLLLLPQVDTATATRRLTRLSVHIANRSFAAGDSRVRLTPVVGMAPFQPGVAAAQLLERAGTAAAHAALHLDLQPAVYDERMIQAPAAGTSAPRLRDVWKERLRLPFQLLVTFLAGIVLPFFAYLLLARYIVDITPVVYMAVVAGLLGTAILIWAEGLEALKRVDPPAPAAPCPPADAIIAAYLPNEAATIVETIEAFLRIDYPAPLQVILAYNTPRPHPIEAVLREIAERHSNPEKGVTFLPLRVETSTSKAQNVNAALAHANGEFVGVFDADHQPQPDSFRRAWAWLSNGWDVVQGHCLIRNGEESWVARMTAIEFEAIYTLSHPGRARLHGFGIFGGSNGYWKTDLLRTIRMHGFMLTEDIDSSLRVIEAGGRIQSDPGLISRELAPAALKALWNQRLRWAQGWFQVSMKHVPRALASRHLSVRQKFGMMHLLLWRELFPWLSLQIIPIIAFWVVSDGLDAVHWFIPVFVFTTAFTLSTGPGQILFTYFTAAPELRRRTSWWVFYAFATLAFYTEFKNVIGRVAQVKQLMGERAWKVTPRTGSVRPDAVP
jgi:DNA-binding response OmpR family regulator/cellulose synthase/poly-beta-1,6-N-acetylglucosamine synthase-like glycosyltransferase